MSPTAAERLSAVLGRRFADPGLLTQALTHSSAAGSRASPESYDRLEFLGDRVLGLVIARLLHDAYPEAPAGELARRYNALVRRETLAAVAREIDLGDALLLAPAERAGGATGNPALLADAMEAVIAVLYLDGGLRAAAAFVRRHWADRAAALAAPPADAKTALQEWAQAGGRPAPRYRLVARTGPEHKPQFTVEAVVEGLAPGVGEGNSKREAEQAAAASLLRRTEGEP